MGPDIAVASKGMTIHYALTRGEVARSYMQSISKSPEFLRRIMVLAAFCALIQLLTRLMSSHRLGSAEILSTLVVFVVVIAFLPIPLFLLAKTQERTLTISPDGISSSIGSKSGQVPWNKVKIVTDGENFILIANNIGNAFFIPDRAFAAPEQRSRFLSQMALWRANS